MTSFIIPQPHINSQYLKTWGVDTPRYRFLKFKLRSILSSAFRNAVVGIFLLVVILTLALIFWPRKTKEEELAGSTAKKVCIGMVVCLLKGQVHGSAHVH